MVINGCSWLMIGSSPKQSSFKYYSTEFSLQVNSALITDGFYYYKHPINNSGDLYYSYLRFYEDGRVNSKLTKGAPEIMKESYWPFNDAYGYYNLDSNHIAYELRSRYGTYVHGEGEINNDTISLKIFKRWNNGDTTYFCNYILHTGFALQNTQ